MIVTDLQYGIENKLIRKLDLMIDRCTRERPVLDAWIINEGGEGSGKTNASIAEAYYVKSKTNRPISLWFRLQPMIDFAKRTSKQIIIWDEPAFDSLKTDSSSILNKNLMRLQSTCRKKQHFLIVNMTRFYRFSEPIVVERCLGLIHLYSRKEMTPGRFYYIKKKKLESLYLLWNQKHERAYKKFKSFRGSFPEVMEKHFHKMGINIEGNDNCTLADYEHYKDKSIASIGEQNVKITKKEIKALNDLVILKSKILNIWRKGILNQKELAECIGVPYRTVIEWTKINPNQPISLGNQGFDDDEAEDRANNGVVYPDDDAVDDWDKADFDEDELIVGQNNKIAEEKDEDDEEYEPKQPNIRVKIPT
ncbi:MAG TPA: hypothetical protein VIR31_05805 [Nitrososphaeraceae archaeon]